MENIFIHFKYTKTKLIPLMLKFNQIDSNILFLIFLISTLQSLNFPFKVK